MSIVRTSKDSLLTLAGLLTLDDLRGSEALIPQQRLGLKYFEDLQIKIPREEMEVWNVCISLYHAYCRQQFKRQPKWWMKNFNVHLLGISITLPRIPLTISRRGALNSKEIEILLSHPNYTADETPTDNLLQSIIDKLHSTGHITDYLDLQRDRFDGIAHFPATMFSDNTPPPPHRRIKFRLVTEDAFAFMQLHLTGTEPFLAHLREQAARMGYKLYPDMLEKNHNTALEIFGIDGLRFMDENKDDRYKEGDFVLLDSEEDIFRVLRMKYVPPHQRNW